MRLDDIKENLQDSLENITYLKEQEDLAGEDANVLKLKANKVHDVFRYLSSSLDYIVKDIIEILYESNDPTRVEAFRNSNQFKKSYFPIVADANKFESYMASNQLPKLNSINTKLYNLIKSFQPFEGEDWLVHFKDFRNEPTHNKHLEQKRSDAHVIKGPGINISIPRGGKGSFKNINLEGVRYADVNISDGKVQYTGQGTAFDIKNKAIFYFHGDKYKIISFLEKCYEKINKFIIDVYDELKRFV